MIINKTISPILLILATPVFAWDGFDYDKGTFIEIDRGNLVREGETIEIFDFNDGYKEVEVESIDHYGNTVEVDVYDYDTGEFRTFEMEDD